MSAIDVTHISLGYDEREDRLVLVVSDGAHTRPLLLTRRRAGQLVDGLAHVLEHSSATAVAAPADVRTEIVLLEHEVALATAGAGPGGATQGDAPADLPPRLVERIDATVRPADFVVLLHAAGEPTASLVLNRTALHRFVELVREKCVAAGWELRFGTPWLNAGQMHFTIN